MDERRIALYESWDKDSAVIKARELAAGAGFNPANQMLIATVAAELSTNILRYAGSGELFLSIVRDDARIGVEIRAIDNGSGIEDIDQALQDNFTTTPGSLGLGLPSVRRIMDDFEIDSKRGHGTRILARKWRLLG